MKKRAEVAEMFEKLQVMGGGDMDKVEKTMAKKFGMKPINKEKLMSSNKKNRSSLSGNNGSRQRPSSAKPKRSKKMIKPLIGGNEEQGESIVSGGSSGSFTKVSQGNTRNVRERPSSAAPTRRSAKSASGRIRPSSSSRRKGRGRGKKNGGGKKNNGSSKSRQPDMTIEGIRQRHNEQLLRVLEQEQEQEERRERILRGIKDEEERRRLDRVFGLERAKSSQRIMRITEEHEMVLTNRMAEAGIIR